MKFFTRWAARWRECFVLIGFLLFGQLRLAAGESPLVITDATQIWGLSAEEKSLAHPLQIEGRVSYFNPDPRWKNLWIERNNIGVYIGLSGTPPTLRTGQYVRIEGLFTPNRGLSANDVTVRVIEENAPITPLETKGCFSNFDAFQNRVVTTEGYVDRQQLLGPGFTRLNLIVENRPVICWVKSNDSTPVPNMQGKWVSVIGVYCGKISPTMTSGAIELWTDQPSNVRVIGGLDSNASFRHPVTPLDRLHLTPFGTEVLVRGRVEAQVVGTSLILRDGTGQVEVRSVQSQRLTVGTEIVAVGKVAQYRDQWIVESALYLPTRPLDPSESVPPSDGVLRTVAQVLALGKGEADQGHPIDLSGLVTWSSPESDYLFLRDLTGAIRVYFDRSKTGLFQFGRNLHIAGVSRAGPVASAVELRDFDDSGGMSFPAAKPITLAQALTGKEDGEWVEMSGFVHDIVFDGKQGLIHVATPGGEFTATRQYPYSFKANPGALIRINGVCDNTTDAAGHINGVMLRVPTSTHITIEEDAPVDYFKIPRRAVTELEQLSASQEMLRVRVTGTVQYAIPGQLVYLAEDGKGLRLLTFDSAALVPGDQIEAVGLLGRAGAHLVLRETKYRKTGAGMAPEPLALDAAHPLALAADARLVRLRGSLIALVNRLGQTRLTLRQGDAFFDALLDQPASSVTPEFAIGAGLEVTGVYELVFDDSHRSRVFQLQLRSVADVRVFAAPRFWTVPRVLFGTGILAACTALFTGLQRREKSRLKKLVALRTGQLTESNLLLVSQVEEIRALSLAKTEFVRTLSHELRNPIAGARMMADQLSRSERDAVSSRQVSNLRNCVKYLQTLLDDTLDITQVESGHVAVKLEQFTTATLLQEVASIFENIAQEKKLKFEIIPGSIPDRLLGGDKTHSKRILVNYLSNAFKFTTQGTVVLRAEPVFQEGDICRVRFEVSDTGPGISEALQGHIFSKFVRESSHGGNDSMPGAGLGLALCKQLAELTGGAVGFSTKVGEGSVFWAELPFITLKQSERLKEEKSMDLRPDFSDVPVCVIDDDPLQLEAISSALEEFGVVPATAKTTKEALELFQATGFSMVIIDYHLGQETGIQLLLKAREQSSLIDLSSTQFHLITSLWEEGLQEKAVAAGFRSAHKKPLSLVKLFHLLEAARRD